MSDTNTTIQRLLGLMRDEEGRPYDLRIDYAAQTLAAEIDAKDERIAALEAQLAEAQADLAKCRGNEEFWKAWNDDDKLGASNDEMLRIAAQRDAAQAKAEAWDRMNKLHAEGWSVEYSLATARRLAEMEGKRV